MEDMNILNSMVDLSKMADIQYSKRAWIGLHDDWDSWRWSLSNKGFYKYGETEFRSWADGEPNNAGGTEHCADMGQHGGLWEDVPCERTLQAICMLVNVPTTERVIKVRVSKKTSGQDLNEPAVMEEMLEKAALCSCTVRTSCSTNEEDTPRPQYRSSMCEEMCH
ncbi:hypothetical protein GBF38_015766, partial [Nibea albiflora]